MAPKVGTRIFLRFDSKPKGRLLAAGTVVSVEGQRWTVDFEPRRQAIEVGEEKLVYYNRGREFLEQTVQLEAEESSGPASRLILLGIDEPVSVGTRSEDRVDTTGCGLEATLAGDSNCPVQDVSLSGLAVIATRAHPVGSRVGIAIRFGDEEFVGEVEVRVSIPLADGRTQHGLLGVFDGAAGKRLESGLTRMTLEIQQQKLKRKSASS
jgi:hypothetical protein